MLFQLLLIMNSVIVAFLAESGLLPQLAANIVIFQTNAQVVGIFSSLYSFVFHFAFTAAKT